MKDKIIIYDYPIYLSEWFNKSKYLKIKQLGCVLSIGNVEIHCINKASQKELLDLLSSESDYLIKLRKLI